MLERETSGEPRFSWPSDYYSSATPQPLLPRWAKYGCGATALLVILLIFTGGAFLAGGGFVDFMDLVLGMSVGEMKGMYTSSVTPDQRKALDAEIERLRVNLREGRTSIASLQPFLEEMRKTTGDNTVTPEEAERLRISAKSAAAPSRP